MNPRRFVQLTGLSIMLLSGSFIAYTSLTNGRPYRVGDVRVNTPTLGQAQPTVTLVADLACPHCADFDSVKGKRLEAQARAGELRLAYLLVARQEGGDLAGNAALCVHDQNPDAFWPYKSSIYELDAITHDTLMAAASELDLDQQAFGQCVAEQPHAKTLEQNEQVAKELGIRGTPTLIAQNVAYPNPSTAEAAEVAGE